MQREKIGLPKPQLKVENFPDLPLPPVDFNDLVALLENLGVARERFSFSTAAAVSDAIQPARQARHIPGVDEEPGDWWIEENQEEATLWLPVMGLQLRLLLPFVKAEVQLSGASTLSPVQWRNVLRVLYFYGFLEYTGLLLHASGLVRGNRAYVFPGVSDAGKTTIVRHSPGMPVLSDEVVAVRLGGRNEVPVAFGTPFYGDWGRPGEKIHLPIQGLYFPVKSAETRLEPLTPRETLTRLLPCIFSYTVFPARLEKLVDFGIQLASQVPAFAFYFQPGAKMWEAIDAP
jgi:hypothetical protein